MRLLSFVLIGFLASPAFAAPPRKVVRTTARSEGPDGKASRTLAAELRRGRALAARRKHTAAIAAFEAALRAVPDEPRVLLELGWELRVTGDLSRAEQVCRRAAQPTSEPTVRAPALYNLGRVLEQKRDKPGAIAAYRESLDLRENRIVRERLLALDPSATSDATRPQPLEGPLPSVEAWCAARTDGPCDLAADADIQVKLGEPEAPWREARVFTTREVQYPDTGGGPDICVLALRTERGWFFTPLATCRDAEWRNGAEVTLEAEDLLASPGSELRVTVQATDSMKDFDEESGTSVCCLESELSIIAVCGVGPSQVPSCTPAIALSSPLEPNPQGGDVGLAPSFAGDELTLRRTDGKPADHAKPRLHPELRALAGRHRLRFP